MRNYYDYNFDSFETGKVIAAFNKNFAHSSIPESYISHVLDGIDYIKTEIIFYPEDTEQMDNDGEIILIYLKNKNKSAVINAVEKLSSNPYVLYAEPDYLEKLLVIPNDPLFKQLWGIQRINAPLAWNYSRGNSHISVGVIDTGIDHFHPDIRDNMWFSLNRQFVNGWNFGGNNSNSMDTDGHGTHIAGTIGAIGNNYIGITGICWNIRIASLRFSLDNASAIAAINFANQFNINILNASWGSYYYSQALKSAIDQYKGLFIAAAGNDGMNNDVEPIYPASYDSNNIISVAAVTQDNILARFSNFGARSVDIAAPGTRILSLGLHGEYSNQNGTSMSAPHVAGAAALLQSYMPGLSISDTKNIILSSAVRQQSLVGRILTGGTLDMNAMFVLANRLQQS
ncbi:MAG: S8 family serine peptidase [Clostridiales bacterium]|jgi:subtilisin family serine protease|nr:S8 family serine peptidase [Clostridiales bacterium]